MNDMRGRVMGVYGFVFFGFMPVGALRIGAAEKLSPDDDDAVKVSHSSLLVSSDSATELLRSTVTLTSCDPYGKAPGVQKPVYVPPGERAGTSKLPKSDHPPVGAKAHVVAPDEPNP